MPIRRFATWTMLLALVSGFTAIAPATAATNALVPLVPATFGAIAGGQSTDHTVQAAAFLPNDITIDQGDTITWSFPGTEAHTVTFVPPGQTPPPPNPGTPNNSTFDGTKIVNSGTITGGGTYTITFGATGDFQFICLIHKTMTGTMHVAPVNTPRSETGANSLLNQGNQEKTDLLNLGTHQQTRELNQQTKTSNINVTIGSGTLLQTDAGTQTVFLASFLPATRSVAVGTTVVWTATDPAIPHTVTFGPQPPNPSQPVNVTNGHGSLPTNPPGMTVSSGSIGDAFPTQTFSITFTAPGTFSYYCAFHQQLGMTGTITVS